MQNTSPGPEGKRGRGRQRTEYECRHFRVGLLSACLQPWRRGAQAQARGWQSPFCRPAGARPLTDETRGPAGQRPGGRAIHTAGWWKAALCTPLLGKLSEGGLTPGGGGGPSGWVCLPAPRPFPSMECPAGNPSCLRFVILALKITSLYDSDEAESNSLYSKLRERRCIPYWVNLRHFVVFPSRSFQKC